MANAEKVTLTAEFKDELSAKYGAMVQNVEKGAGAVATAEKKATVSVAEFQKMVENGARVANVSTSQVAAGFNKVESSAKSMATNTTNATNGINRALKETASSAASVESSITKAHTGLQRFGLEGEGVLKKLARQLSATDLVAAGVFGTIAAGQAVITNSIHAYDSLVSVYEKVTGQLDAMAESRRRTTKAEREAAEDLGAQLSTFRIGLDATKDLIASMSKNPSGGVAQEQVQKMRQQVAYMDDLQKQLAEAAADNKVLLDAQAEKAKAITEAEKKRLELLAKQTEEFRRQLALMDKYRTTGPENFSAMQLTKYYETHNEDDSLKTQPVKSQSPYQEFDYGNAQHLPTDYEKWQSMMAEQGEAYNRLARIGDQFSHDILRSFTDMVFHGRNLMESIKESFFRMLESLIQNAAFGGKSGGGWFADLFKIGISLLPIPGAGAIAGQIGGGGGGPGRSGGYVPPGSGLGPMPAPSGRFGSQSTGGSIVTNHYAITVQMPPGGASGISGSLTSGGRVRDQVEMESAMRKIVEDWIAPALNQLSYEGRY